WAEGLGGFLGLFALWGAVRAGHLRALFARDRPETDVTEPPARLRMLLTVYLVLFGLVLVRHVTTLGYLSDRHLLPMVAVALPWTAAGVYVCVRRVVDRAGWEAVRVRRVVGALV